MADAAVIERLLADAEALPDPVARDTATALATALLALYGDGLSRIVAIVADHDGDGALAEALVDDELVAHLLLLHGLHPEPVRRRVERALDEVRPYLEAHRGDVELLGIDGGVVHVRLLGTCDGCASSSATLTHAIEDAVQRAAPEVHRVEAEAATRAPAPALLQLECSPALLHGRS